MKFRHLLWPGSRESAVIRMMRKMLMAFIYTVPKAAQFAISLIKADAKVRCVQWTATGYTSARNAGNRDTVMEVAHVLVTIGSQQQSRRARSASSAHEAKKRKSMVMVLHTG